MLFPIATMIPVLLLFSAAFSGGLWIWAAFGYITVLAAALDQLAIRTPARDPDQEFPLSEMLTIVLGVAHFLLFALAIMTLGNGWHSWIESIVLLIAFSLFFGQISHPNAHELIHNPAREPRILGRMVYASMLIGHHASAHLFVHHVLVASEKDPNSAYKGESFYYFFARSWKGSFLAGLKAETARREHAGHAVWQHTYASYLGMAVFCLISALVLAGFSGLFVFLLMAFYAQMQILMSDYVQHYGLRRGTREDGKLLPVGPQHSWNAPHFFSSALMLNAPRHSDHHMHPSRPYPALNIDEDMPILPNSLPVMAVLALWPDKWRERMDPLVTDWERRT